MKFSGSEASVSRGRILKKSWERHHGIIPWWPLESWTGRWQFDSIIFWGSHDLPSLCRSTLAPGILCHGNYTWTSLRCKSGTQLLRVLARHRRPPANFEGVARCFGAARVGELNAFLQKHIFRAWLPSKPSVIVFRNNHLITSMIGL